MPSPEDHHRVPPATDETQSRGWTITHTALACQPVYLWFAMSIHDASGLAREVDGGPLLPILAVLVFSGAGLGLTQMLDFISRAMVETFPTSMLAILIHGPVRWLFGRNSKPSLQPLVVILWVMATFISN